MRKLVLLILLLAGTVAQAEDVRLPVIRQHSLSATVRPSRTVEDTFTLNLAVGSFMLVFSSDSTCYMNTKADTPLSRNWEVLGGQYYPDPNLYIDGDTVVFLCKTCGSDTAEVHIRAYRAGEVR